MNLLILKMKMKLAPFFVPKIISRVPSSLKLGCIDPTSSRIKHQLCHNSGQHDMAGMRSSRKKLLLGLGDSSGQSQSQSQSLLAGELSDSRWWGSGKHVPKGFVAVLVGPQLRRFVIPISFLTMPELRVVMERVAEEFECDYGGAVEIPCEEHHFEQILMTCLARHKMIMSSKIPKKLRKLQLHL